MSPISRKSTMSSPSPYPNYQTPTLSPTPITYPSLPHPAITPPRSPFSEHPSNWPEHGPYRSDISFGGEDVGKHCVPPATNNSVGPSTGAGGGSRGSRDRSAAAPSFAVMRWWVRVGVRVRVRVGVGGGVKGVVCRGLRRRLLRWIGLGWGWCRGWRRGWRYGWGECSTGPSAPAPVVAVFFKVGWNGLGLGLGLGLVGCHPLPRRRRISKVE